MGTSRADILEAGADHLPLQLLNLPGERPAETLVVCFHGSLDRVRYELPRFERVRSLTGLPAHRLYLADPTLLLSENIRIGWYLGSLHDDVIERYARLIRHAATALRVRRVLLTGASAGGFAALALTPRIPNSLALAFSPQANIGRFGRSWTRTLAKWAFDGQDFAELEEADPARFDIAQLYRRLPAGRAWYVQNSGDRTHLARQMKPLQATSDERIVFLEEFHAEGHTPPTAERTRAWIEHAVHHFWGDPRGFRLPR